MQSCYKTEDDTDTCVQLPQSPPSHARGKCAKLPAKPTLTLPSHLNNKCVSSCQQAHPHNTLTAKRQMCVKLPTSPPSLSPHSQEANVSSCQQAHPHQALTVKRQMCVNRHMCVKLPTSPPPHA
eukprot:638872-Pelagomonas_calceolata.AAC.2